MPTINVDDELDRWQWVCPAHEHRNWEAWNEHFYCNGCAEGVDHNPDLDPETEYLKNIRTGAVVHRSDIELTSDRGNWRTPGSA